MKPEDWTDEELLAELAEALRAEQEVPAALVDSGKAVWTWRTVDAELAALTYDSAAETAHGELALIRSEAAPGERARPRAEAAPLRSLTYASTHFIIDLEVTRDALLGQVQPADAVRA